MIRKKFPTQWKRFQSSRIITLIVNWVQRFQSELTAKFTIEFFFQRHILFYLHSKSTLIPVTTIGDFFWLIPPSSLACLHEIKLICILQNTGWKQWCALWRQQNIAMKTPEMDFTDQNTWSNAWTKHFDKYAYFHETP